MPTASAPKVTRAGNFPPRHWSQLDPALGDPIRTLDLVLASEGIAKGTRRIYCESLTWFAQRAIAAATGQSQSSVRDQLSGNHSVDEPDKITGWSAFTQNDVRQHLAWMIDQGYSTSYISNQLRGMKAGFKRLAKEESIPDVLKDITGPTPVAKLVPVLEDGELGRLLAACNPADGGVSSGKDAGHEFIPGYKLRRRRSDEPRWIALRDKAMILVLASSGCRLGELAQMTIPDVDIDQRVARVVGKGSKPRFIRFDQPAALAIARYLRARRSALLPVDSTGSLWVGMKGPLTVSGCFQAFKRRARQAGMPDLHPHSLRHNFASAWLSRGGEEGDLMRLAGWSSRSMLDRYGASAAAARASAAYDRVMGQ